MYTAVIDFDLILYSSVLNTEVYFTKAFQKKDNNVSVDNAYMG